VKATIPGLKLHREVVFIADNAFQALTASMSEHSGPVAGGFSSVRLEDLVANRLGWQSGPIGREVGPKKSTFAGNGVAIRAFALAEEYFFAAYTVSWGYPRLEVALKDSDVADERANLWPGETVKRWHAGAGDSIRNKIGYLGIREMAYIDAARDVGPLIAPTTIQSVASSAAGIEGALAGDTRCLFLITPKIMFLSECGGSAQQE
jgi:hypothetical protein